MFMNLLFRIALIVLIGTIQDSVLAQNEIATLTAEQARADFDFLRRVLEEAHAGLYRYSTKADMDRVFDAQRARLNRAMRKTEFMILLSETTTAIRCGHTDIRPDGQIADAMEKDRKFPLRLRLEGDRLVVAFNDTPADDVIRPGMDLLEVNGHKSPS